VISATALAHLAGLFPGAPARGERVRGEQPAVSRPEHPGLQIRLRARRSRRFRRRGDTGRGGHSRRGDAEPGPDPAVRRGHRQRPAGHLVAEAGGPGTISAAGLYTAPSAVTQVEYAHVTATTESANGTAEAAQALVTLVPRGVQVSPSFVLMTRGMPRSNFRPPWPVRPARR